MANEHDVAVGGVQSIAKLIDSLIEKLRSALTPAIFNSHCKWLTVVGHYALLALVVFIVMMNISLAIKYERMIYLAHALGWVVAIIVGQYIAVKFLPKSYELIEAQPTELYTPAYLNSIVLVNLVVIGFALVMSIYWAARYEQMDPFWTGLCIAALCFYWAFQALHPSIMNIRLSYQTKPAQEALNIGHFLLKANYRAVPIAYGLGLTLAALKILIACFYFWFGKRYLGRGYYQSGIFLLLFFMLLPFYSFLVYITVNLILDTFRSILSRLERPAN